MSKISVFTPALRWCFRDGAYVLERNTIGSYQTRTKVDPTPGYAHDKQLVKQLLAKVAAAFPIGWPVSLNILSYETFERTNGWASTNSTYSKPPRFEGAITLAGKRIPPHPAVTRYLVAHEYGHLVDRWICKQRGLADGQDFDQEYRELRGVKRAKYYGPGQWHAETGELIANDFRILVAESEPEFWPHPGFARPETLPAVVDWWHRARAEHGA